MKSVVKKIDKKKSISLNVLVMIALNLPCTSIPVKNWKIRILWSFRFTYKHFQKSQKFTILYLIYNFE